MSAQVHDLGYREYDGQRAGVGSAMTTLGIHAGQRVLGLKRSARHKILPVIVIIIAFIPAIVFVGMAAFLPTSLLEEDILPSYAEYYGFIFTAIFLFASFVAPEAICTDRRTGMLALYLASPLNRTTYIVSKMAAVAVVLMTITLLPEVGLLVAYTIEGAGPDGIDGFVETLARITLAGVIFALFYAALTSAIASFTPRRGIASAAIVIVLIVPGIIISSILDATDVADELGLLNVSFLPFRAAWWILQGEPSDERGLEQVSGALATLVTLGATALFAGITWYRYQKLEVER
ncbi:MAG: ABC transporter permease [Acidimicrobiales bacterium]